ncbi:MAG: DUF488 domain-containing protein [Candidatus Hecatellaceae archaeon]
MCGLKPQQPITLYTYGHSTRSLEEFIQTLKALKVEVAVDVRRFPGSKKYPHFSREVLAEELPKAGIRYVWLGELLGGYRPGGYQNYMRTKTFKEGFQRLVKMAGEARTVVFCSEALWFRCHRRFLADRLTKLGFQVYHVYDAKRLSLHKVKRKR